MPDLPPVTVVVPARNAAATLGAQLDALARQAYDGWWEVVLVDNASDDETTAVARRFADRFPELRIVSAETPGINCARNAGGRVARGDLLVFCDADDIVADGWLAAMVGALTAADAVGGAIDHWTLNSPGVRFRVGAGSDGLLSDGDFLPYPHGASCGVHASVFHALGGFDDRFTSGDTEAEFFWRAQLAGHSLTFVPEAVVHYRHRPDLGGLARQRYRRGLGHVRRYRLFRAHGMPRGIGAALRGWIWLVTHLGDLARSPRHRRRWAARAATRSGRVVGSIQQRVLYL